MTDTSHDSTPLEEDPKDNTKPTSGLQTLKSELNNPPDVEQESSSPCKSIESPQSDIPDPIANSSCNPKNQTIPTTVNAQLLLEQQLQKCKKDLEAMVLRYANSERENLQNKKKVDDLDKKLKKSIKDNEQLANRIRLLTNDKNQLTDTLNAKVAQLTVLEQKNSHLTNVQGARLKECEEKIVVLEQNNSELTTQIEAYKSKEGELLDFSERLSMKHMLIQNELDEALKKLPNYKDLYEGVLREKEVIEKNQTNLEEKIKLLETKLKGEQECSESLRSDIDKIELKHKYQLDELHNEIKVIRRKHQIANKELIKEIKQLHSKMENSKENVDNAIKV